MKKAEKIDEALKRIRIWLYKNYRIRVKAPNSRKAEPKMKCLQINLNKNRIFFDEFERSLAMSSWRETEANRIEKLKKAENGRVKRSKKHV